jgi:hypothetical protein
MAGISHHPPPRSGEWVSAGYIMSGELTLKNTLTPIPSPKMGEGRKNKRLFLTPPLPLWERGLRGEGIFVRLINLT